MRAIFSSLGFLPGVICKYYDWLTITKEDTIVDILGQEGVGMLQIIQISLLNSTQKRAPLVTPPYGHWCPLEAPLGGSDGSTWMKLYLMDWSLITGRAGLQNGKIAGPKLFPTPPQDRAKHVNLPLLKGGNLLCYPSIMHG